VLAEQGRGGVPQQSSETVLRMKQQLDRRARFVWPLIRPLVRGKLAKRCARCSLPEAFTKLDAQGICGECATHHAKRAQEAVDPVAEAKLARETDEALRAAQGAAKGPYDAVLLLSGGKDSIYLIHRIRKEYPDLRILSLLVDNNYMSPVALRNAELAAAQLDVEHVTIRLRPSFVHAVFRYVLTRLERPKDDYPLYALLTGHMAFDTGRGLAARVGAPLLLTGLSRVQNVTAFGGLELPDQLQASRSGIPLDALTPSADRHHWFEPSQWPADRIPRVISPIAIWNLSEIEITEAVLKAGLLPASHVSPVVTSDVIYATFLIAEINQFGYSSVDLQWAHRIRAGIVERSYWINILQMMEYSARTGRTPWFKNALATAWSLGVNPREIGLPA